MKTKLRLVLILVLMMLAQACAPRAVPAGPASSSGPTSAADACPTAGADTKLLTNTKDGYCLLYPAEDSAELAGWVVVNPNPNPGDMPGDAWVYIQVQDAAGRSAADVAREAVAAAGTGFNITRSEALVDGSQAVVIDGLPGQDSNRMVLIARNNRLYTLTFAPWYPAAGSGQTTALEHLYETVINSIHFTSPA